MQHETATASRPSPEYPFRNVFIGGPSREAVWDQTSPPPHVRDLKVAERIFIDEDGEPVIEIADVHRYRVTEVTRARGRTVFVYVYEGVVSS